MPVIFRFEPEFAEKFSTNIDALLRRAFAEVSNIGNGYNIARLIFVFVGEAISATSATDTASGEVMIQLDFAWYGGESISEMRALHWKTAQAQLAAQRYRRTRKVH